MKKNIMTLGFLVALSTISLGQTNENPANPANKPVTKSGKLEPAQTPAGSADQKQREEVERAGTPANANPGIQISTPDPRVESPGTSAPLNGDPASLPPAPPTNRASSPAPGAEQRSGTPASKQSTGTKPAAETKPQNNEARPSTPQPASQPKKQTPAKTEKTQTPR